MSDPSHPVRIHKDLKLSHDSRQAGATVFSDETCPIGLTSIVLVFSRPRSLHPARRGYRTVPQAFGWLPRSFGPAWDECPLRVSTRHRVVQRRRPIDLTKRTSLSDAPGSAQG